MTDASDDATNAAETPADSVEHSSTGNRAKPGDSEGHGPSGSRTESDDSVEQGSTSNRRESAGDSEASETPRANSDDTPGGLSKRTLIRLLVGFGIGIPLLVEGITFLGLLDEQFGGGGGEDADTGATATETAPPGIAVGDDLLPETDRSETLASAVLREVGGDRWPLTLTVEVTNSGDTDYEFQLLSVHLEDGRTVNGRTSTDRLAAGETRTITGEWPIPAGSTPRAVDVVALVYSDGSVETVERRVDLAKIPVRGG